jgi:amiloride-sensitive sodium channel
LAPDARGEITLMEQEDALFCPQTCYPSCEATLYDVSATSVPFYKYANDTFCRFWSLHNCRSRFDNTTSIHIYYRDRFHNLFKQDVVHYWFEILSNYGGIFGLIIGLSGISLMEILVQCVKFVKIKL